MQGRYRIPALWPPQQRTGPSLPPVMLVTKLGDKTSYLLLLTHNISYSHYNKNLGLDVLKGFLGGVRWGLT